MMNKWKAGLQAGFTLLELLIAIFMLAILAVAAAPSFSTYLKTNGIFSHRQDINSAVMTARSEALNRNKTVTICSSNDAATCGGTWSDGWIVFLDDGAGGGDARDGELNGSEEVINAFAYEGQNKISVIDADADSDLDFLSFNEQGRPALNGVQTSRRVLITICDRDDTATLARGLLLIGSGRLIHTRDTDNDGVHESRFADNAGSVDIDNNLSCN